MKWIVRIIGVLVLILVVAVVSLMLLPADRIARIASDQLENLTGRKVAITGDVGMTFWPVLGVKAEGLEVGNVDWAKDGAMLSAANAAIGVDAWSLLTGDIRITNVEAQSPVIRLEQRADGRASWQFTDAGGAQIETQTPAATATNAPRKVTIQRLNVTDATLIYDAEGSPQVIYSGVDLSLDWPEHQGDAVINAAMRPAAEPVRLEATIDRFDQFLAGDVRPVSVRVSAKGGGVTLEGRASLQGAVAGDVWLKTSDTGRFLAELGLAGVSLPAGLGATADVRTQLTLTPDRRLALRDLVADLGGNSLSGGADITLTGTPNINAQLVATALDLSGVAGSDSGGAGSGAATPAAAGWSKTPIDASGLAAFNGEIGLRADSIDLGTLTLGPTRVLLRNDNARMVAELREITAYAGTLTGEFIVNNRNGLSVGGTLSARSMAMQPMLRDMAGLERFTGTGDADLSFLGVGQSMDAIIRSLQGKGAITVGRGSITGIDLDKLMGNFDVAGGTTVFDSLAATFTIEAGVLRNSDLSMLLPNFNATGAGQVGLGAQTIDYTVTPKALRVNGDRGLAIPVRIVGPWFDPKIRPDVQAALDLNFAAEKEQVKQKLEQKLAEELNVVPQDGQSTEEMIRDGVEGKLKKELLKLFE
jgi:AsmA protein